MCLQFYGFVQADHYNDIIMIHDISNLRQFHCLFERMFICTSKKTSKRRVTGPLRSASNVENYFYVIRSSCLWINGQFTAIAFSFHGVSKAPVSASVSAITFHLINVPLFMFVWLNTDTFDQFTGTGEMRLPNAGEHESIRNSIYHDDVIKWKHFPRYWPFVGGIHRWPENSPHKGKSHGALMISLIKRLSKPSRRWRFETPSRWLWRHRNGEECCARTRYQG